MLGLTSFALACSLSMDSFAAALSCGAGQQKCNVPEAVRVSTTFGITQPALALAGWMIGASFAGLVQAIDHWIAFGLLLLIGGMMVRGALEGEGGSIRLTRRMSWLALLSTAVATSIDASAVGVGLALADIDIASTATMVGVVTFTLAFGGVMLGRAIGPLIGRRAELIGGLGLIAIGCKILFEHLTL